MLRMGTSGQFGSAEDQLGGQAAPLLVGLSDFRCTHVAVSVAARFDSVQVLTVPSVFGAGARR